MDTIYLGPGLTLPTEELDFSFTRSGGPGGQHVNRSETKVELRWNVATSATLDEAQRATIQARLASYLTDEGILRLTSDETRSQHRNRAAVIQRLRALVGEALRPRRARRPTRPPAAAHARRVEGKKRQGAKKAARGRIDPHAD